MRELPETKSPYVSSGIDFRVFLFGRNVIRDRGEYMHLLNV
jgi:hypothetical protein